jgi:hypothetical protein
MLVTGKLAKSRDEEALTEPLRISDLRSIAPHLQRTTMLFSHVAKSRESKLLLSCPLVLDEWTSEAELNPEISISIPDLAGTKRFKVERDIKRLFNSLLRDGKGREGQADNGDRDAEAIVKAAEGVMGVFFGLDVLTARSNGHGK